MAPALRLLASPPAPSTRFELPGERTACPHRAGTARTHQIVHQVPVATPCAYCGGRGDVLLADAAVYLEVTSR